MKTLMTVLVAAVLLGHQAPNQGDQASNPQKLVSPSEYRTIPQEVRDFLVQRHCQLPETKNYGRYPMNVVSNHFAKADQTDWAALCVVDDQPRVVVLWRGKTGCSDEIHSGWPLQGAFSKEPAGGLFLRPISPKQILAYRKFFRDDHSNDIDHEGIEVGDDQASLIYYCDGKNWLELQGND